MGLRCSLLGHDYGESFVERGREERGNEVVVTERELQECARCGAENVTTENTEVRSIEPTGSASTAAPDAGAATDAASTADAARGDSSPGDATAASSGGGASAASSSDSPGGAFTSASDAIERAEAGTQTGDTGSASDAGDDDAVIIDDSADDGAGSEQWDEQADVDPGAEHEPTPEPDDEDVEFVDSAPAGDVDSAPTGDADTGGVTAAGAESASAGGQTAGAQTVTAERSSDRTRGEWPELDDEDIGVDATDDDVSFQFGDESEQFVATDTGFTSAGPLEQTGGDDDLDFALYCPECGFDRHAAGSSLRAGDICPDCRKGYLAEDR